MNEDSGLWWTKGQIEPSKPKPKNNLLSKTTQAARKAAKKKLASNEVNESYEKLTHMVKRGDIKVDKIGRHPDGSVILVHRPHKEYSTPYVNWISNDLHHHGIKHSIVDSGTINHGQDHYVKIHLHEETIKLKEETMETRTIALLKSIIAEKREQTLNEAAQGGYLYKLGVRHGKAKKPKERPESPQYNLGYKRGKSGKED